MEVALKDSNANMGKENKVKTILKKMRQQKYLCLMSLPFFIWVIIFRYIPLWGWTMAFQEYKPGLGFFEQEFAGLKYFGIMLQDPQFYVALKNTLGMSILTLIVNFTFPIVLAILLSEIRAKRFQKVVQTISYLPHFVSWVIVASMVTSMLASDGFINQMLISSGLVENAIPFMAKPEYFWGIVTMTDLWKELGWNSIIFLAAIAGISPELYEAAAIDGAGKFKRVINITIPAILPTVMIMLIMSIGNIINIGFERQMLLSNSLVSDSARVLDMYILDYGIRSGRYAFGTAVGMFKSVVSIIMVFMANAISKKLTGVKMI